MEEQTPSKRLIRAIGRWDLVALAINGIVGAGIFGLASKSFSLAGAWSLLAFLVCGGLATLIALCFAEVGSRYRQTGGPYLYARDALGDMAGFTVGGLWWLSRVAAYAANINLLVSYAAFVLPSLQDSRLHAAVIFAITIGLLVINIAGVRDSTFTSNVLTAAKLSVLALFVLAGLTQLHLHRIHFDAFPNVDHLSTAILLLVYAFTGFEMVAVPAGEVQDPQRDLPFALLVAIGTVVLLYTGIQIVCIGTLPGLAESDRPLADAARQFVGVRAAQAVVCGALVSIAGNLNLLLLASSRIPFAMAERGDLPIWMARIHSSRHTPYAALIVTSAAMMLLSLSHSFLAAVTVASVCRLIAYGATAISLLRLRQRPDTRPAPFQLRFAPLLVTLTLALIMWLLLRTTRTEQLETGLLTGLAVLWFIWNRLET